METRVIHLEDDLAKMALIAKTLMRMLVEKTFAAGASSLN